MRDLLLLTRAPLAATAVANGALGVLVVWPVGRVDAPAALVALAFGLASALLYAAGMALNDVFDLERDRRLHPQRPLPSGRVSRRTGALLGAGLLAGGVALGAALAGALAGRVLAGLLAGGAVAAAVLSYDGLLKRWTAPGSLAMGACRFANALLGPAALGAAVFSGPDGSPALAYASLVGAYVAALTWVSTFKDRRPSAAERAGAFAAVAAAPLGALLLSALAGGWSPLGALGWGPLAVLVWRQAWAAEAGEAGAHGRTIALLKGLWLLDLGVVLAALEGELLAAGLLILAALYGVGTWGAKRLWARPGPAAVSGGT